MSRFFILDLIPQTRLRRLRRFAMCASVVVLFAGGWVHAADDDTPFLAWKPEIAEFAAADQSRRPEQNGVLFVGSSTIRLWRNLSQDFRAQPVVINRGFGGSTLQACHFFAKELIVQYQPAHVLVYAGENDLAIGRSPEDVLDSFVHLADTIRSELPNTRISYISIKPSPSREKHQAAMQKANRLIQDFVGHLTNAEYIDIYTAMLGTDGKPRPELFLPDMLHMNETGYALWQSLIAPHLTETESAPSGLVRSDHR